METEPNDSKGAANVINLTGAGDTITGNSQASTGTGLDYFRVTTPIQPIAIYQNRLTLNQANTGTIRGLGQTASNPTNSSGPGTPSPTATDNPFQSSSTATGQFNQWYSFGRTGSLYYRVTGTATTTANYVATYAQTVITPVNLGSFAAGSITLTNTQLNSTQDTEILVYDSMLMPLAGFLNDDFLDGTVTQTGGSNLNSLLTREFAPGIYFVAISNFNTADNRLSPADEGTASGTYLDFDGVTANSSTTALASIPFRISDANGNTDFTATKPGAYDVYWGTFTVVPEPGSVALTLAGAAGLAAVIARRRRRLRGAGPC